MNIKRISILIISLFAISLSACGKSNSKVTSEDIPGGNTKRTYGKYVIKDEAEDISDIQGEPWVNTSISGVMNKIEKPSLKDDYFANINYDYLSEYTLPEGEVVHGGDIFRSQDLVNQRIKDIINDPSDVTIANILNKIKVGQKEKILTEVDRIWNLSHDGLINELNCTDFLFSGPNSLLSLTRESKSSDVVIDISCAEEFVTLPYLAIKNILNQTDYGIGGFSLQLRFFLDCHCSSYSDDYFIALCNSISYYLDAYIESEPSLSGVGSFNSSPNTFNLNTILESMGFTNESLAISEPLTMILDDFYMNLLCLNDDQIKSYLMDTYLLNNIYFLGVDDYVEFRSEVARMGDMILIPPVLQTEGLTGDNLAYKIFELLFPEVINRLYIDTYVTPEIRFKVQYLVEDILDQYKNMFDNCSWLSRDTKDKAIEKLSNMNRIVFYTDELPYYDPISFTTIESNDLVTIYKEYEHYYITGVYERVFFTDPIFVYFHPYTINSAYSNETNSIYICHGIMSSFIDSTDLTDEKFYATVGTIIGHEISHAFDNVGSLIWQGKLENWWTDEDRQTFNNKVDKLIRELNRSIKPFKEKPVNGENIAGEVIADMGGMSVILNLIKSKNTTFDMDKYFQNFAKFWAVVYTNKEAYNRNIDDAHALSYIRVNLTLMQFDEFKNRYSIMPGDTMYLEPTRNIAIW